MSEHRQSYHTTLQPGVIIEWTDWKDRTNSYQWRVLGIHLGAENQEHLVALESVSLKPGWNRTTIEVMHVPMCLIYQCRVVRSGGVDRG